MICPRPVARLLRLLLAWACSQCGVAWLAGAEATRTWFSIAGGDAALTLRQLSRQANESVVFPIELVQGIRTLPVQGDYTAREAAEQMVAGTDLFVSQDLPTGALTISRRPHRNSVTPPPPSPQPPEPQPMKSRTLIALLAGWLTVSNAGQAQLPPSGTITGRILNPSTGEYVRNAQVRQEATGVVTTSEAGGEYRLSPAGPGQVTLTVTYTGYRTATATVTVAPGATVTQNFELVSTLDDTAGRSAEAIKLDAFVVSSQREGNAKAIMEQRRSMDITNSVSSDVLGEVAEGNVGEFLKHMPGVDYDSLDGTVRYVSLRGLSSEYAGVTVDGINYPSADGGATSRAFSFEQVSLSAMESIEVSKTISADADASAPAGTINLKTKRAFDRMGRRVSASFSLTGQSNQFTFDKTYGPGDDPSRKIFPSAQFEYSDVFLNKRLGIVFGLSESNSYLQRAPTTMTYNYTPTAASPDPVALTAIRVQQIHQTIERFATSLTADFKATPRLVLSLSIMYNHSDVWSGQRAATFNTGARVLQVAGDPLIDFTTTANGSFTIEPQGIAKVGNGKSYSPRFEYKYGDLKVEGRFSASDSTSVYDPMKYRNSVFSPGLLTLSNVRLRAVRSSLNDGNWKIQQTAGGDWNNGALFTTPTITLDDGRSAGNKLYTGEGIVTYQTRKFLPVVWKAGAKWKREVRDFRNERAASFYNYTGPGAGVGAWRDYRSGLGLDFSEQDLYITSLGGGGVFLPDIMKIAQTFREHPEHFAASMSGTDYYNSQVANEKHYEEEIASLYLMGTTQVGKLNLRAGLRREATTTDSLEFDALSSREVAAAGFPVAGGRATTIPGVQYQFMSRPQIHREAEYDKLFPSAAVKYNLTRSLDLQLGFSTTVKRPQFGDVAGVWVINDEALTVTAPNVKLQPETSNNYSMRLARYFEPLGLVAINFYQNDIKGLHQSNTRVDGGEFDPDDPTYDGYTFITTVQSEEDVRVRGMEIEYSQSLSFLPPPFKGLAVRANYSRNYAQVTVSNMTPHLVSAGLSYAFGRANVYANMNWASSRPINSARTQYQRHRINVDLGGSFRLTPKVLAFFSVRNVLNEPFIRMQKVGDTPAAALFYQKFGVTPTIGVRTTF